MQLTVILFDGSTKMIPASIFDSILVSLQKAGVPVRHDCGGKAQCGTCRFQLLSGLLNPPSPREQERLQAVNAEKDTRLACQARPAGDCTIRLLLQPR